MKRYDVELVTMPWRYERRVPLEYALATVVQHVIINGHEMQFTEDYSGDEVISGGASLVCEGFMVLNLNHLTEDSYKQLQLTEDDWLYGSTRENVMLPIASLVLTDVPQDVHPEHIPNYDDPLLFPTT